MGWFGQAVKLFPFSTPQNLDAPGPQLARGLGTARTPVSSWVLTTDRANGTHMSVQRFGRSAPLTHCKDLRLDEGGGSRRAPHPLDGATTPAAPGGARRRLATGKSRREAFTGPLNPVLEFARRLLKGVLDPAVRSPGSPGPTSKLRAAGPASTMPGDFPGLIPASSDDRFGGNRTIETDSRTGSRAWVNQVTGHTVHFSIVVHLCLPGAPLFTLAQAAWQPAPGLGRLEQLVKVLPKESSSASIERSSKETEDSDGLLQGTNRLYPHAWNCDSAFLEPP